MAVENTVAGIKDFIARKTRERWDDLKEPYPLAHVSPDLAREGIKYKDIIFPETLKNFVQSSMSDQVKIFTHPTQKAKIVLMPPGIPYSFDPPVQGSFAVRSAPAKAAGAQDLDTREALFQFLRALSFLPAEDVKAVQIPVEVLVRLASGR